MSAPYPQQPSTGGDRRSFELREILAMGAAGAGVVGYLLGFFDDGVGALMGSMAGVGLISTAALAGMRFLPKTPDALFVAVPLSAYAALALLQDVVRNTASGLVPVLMVLALAQLAAVLGVLLVEGGVIKPGSRSGDGSSRPGTGPQPYGQPPFPQGRPQRGPGGPGGPRPGPGGPGWSPQGQPGAQFGGPPPWNPNTGGQPAQQQSSAADSQQPGGWNPSSGGVPTPGPDSSGPHQNRPGQQNAQPGPNAQSGAQPPQQPQSGPNTQPPSNTQPPPSTQHAQQPKSDQDGGGPQGTRQMPHPGTNPPAF
ncbi:DUF5336 domain-containing protein [Saccharopolyspora sp. ID03-671]|uniref:DUF5336 domain-containing protein n=1 Tax=Saccharopolyspora sp. ID03-671 TaxID=3073066 RepID=UPI00324EAC56